MELKIESSVIDKALNVITRTAPPVSGNVNIKAEGGKLRFFTQSELNRCITLLPCAVSGEAEFAIPIQALRDAIKGRAELSMVFDKQMLKLKSKTYMAELATMDATPIDRIEVGEHEEWALDAATAKWLKSALSEIALRPVVEISPYVPVGILLTPKGVFCSCFDHHRMTWTRSKEIKGNLKLVLPLDSMQSVLEVFDGQPFKIRIGKGMVEVKSKFTEVGLAIPDLSQTGITLEQVCSKVEDLEAFKASVSVSPKAEISAFLDNAKSVLTKERSEVVADKATGVWMLKSISGTAKAKIPASKPAAFKVDYGYLVDAIAKAPEEVTLSIGGDQFVAVKMKNSTTLITQSQ